MRKAILSAKRAFDERKFDSALVLYNQILGQEPNNTTAYVGAAKCLLELRNIEEAIEMSRKTLEIDPKSADAFSVLSVSYHLLNKEDVSRTYAEKAYSLEPESPFVLLTYGFSLLVENKINDAIAILEKALEIEKNYYAVRYNLGAAYLRKKNYRNALKHFREAYRLRPSLSNGLKMLLLFVTPCFFLALGIIFIPLTVGAFAFKNWGLLIIPILYILSLIIIGLRTRSVKSG